MTEEEIVTLMESSKSREEWNKNCDRVKAACKSGEYAGPLSGDYPEFWYGRIVQSGLASRTQQRFTQ